MRRISKVRQGMKAVASLGAIAFTIFAASVRAADVRPVDLRCEYAVDPVGIDTLRPRFFWKLESDKRDQCQTAYQILVASSVESLAKGYGNLWDSGRVDSAETIQIPYDGQPLQSAEKYYWSVRVWDKDGHASERSAPATFTMGLLWPADWNAQWIVRGDEAQWLADRRERQAQEKTDGLDFGRTQLWDIYRFYKKPLEPAPLFRKEFGVGKKVTSAKVFICGLGYYELRLNGERVGDHVLDPALTEYDRRALYASYDVTGQVKQGGNTLGVTLGRGWYALITGDWGQSNKARWIGQPKFILQMRIDYEDGTRQWLGSDATWKTSDSPILMECVHVGEIYDATREQAGWDMPGYDDASWTAAREVPSPTKGLRSQMMEPIKVTQTIKPIAMTREPAGFRYDMGQNMTGWARLHLSGPKGARVVMTFGESLGEDGTLDPRSGAERYQQAIYVLKGEGEETYEPRFTYHGFRYVRIDDFPGTPTLATIEGRWVHSAVAQTGQFDCSNALVDRLQQNIVRTRLNNLHGYPTDCPTREKVGWTGDAQVTATDAIDNLDMARLFTKWIDDLALTQRPEGYLLAVAPTHQNFGWDAPTWTGAYLTIPWLMYRTYGDRRILETHYDSMKRYVDSCEKGFGAGKPYIVGGAFGDWGTPEKENYNPPRVNQLLGTAYYFEVARTMSLVADTLGNGADAKKYRALATNIRDAFNQEFLDAQAGQYLTDMPERFVQAANAVPLQFDLVPPEQREAVLEKVVRDVMDTSKRALDDRHPGHAGAYGCSSGEWPTPTPPTPWPRRRRIRAGDRQILTHDATTCWEYWDGHESRDHPMFGLASHFFLEWLDGIRLPKDGGAFRHVIIGPVPVGDLTHAEGSMQTVRGVCRIAMGTERPSIQFALHSSRRHNGNCGPSGVWLARHYDL